VGGGLRLGGECGGEWVCGWVGRVGVGCVGGGVGWCGGGGGGGVGGVGFGGVGWGVWGGVGGGFLIFSRHRPFCGALFVGHS